jgi:membrane protease YdiL (CAAX protease family)
MKISPNQKQTRSDKSSSFRRGFLLIGTLTLLALVLSTFFKPFSLLAIVIWILWVVVIVACLAPVIALAVWRGKPDGWHEIGLALGFWSMNFSCLILMGRLPIFSSLEWNWTGKIFAILASLAFIGLWRGTTWREIGFTGLRKGSWLPFIVLVLLSFVAFLALYTKDVPTKVETLLFQLIMPGVDEEIVFRGILLLLLNRAFSTSWKLLGANVGWGWIISSVLFGLIHGIGFTGSQFQFQFSLAPIIIASITGLIIGWLRERTGSLYPAIFLHATVDATGFVINALVNGLAY